MAIHIHLDIEDSCKLPVILVLAVISASIFEARVEGKRPGLYRVSEDQEAKIFMLR